VFGGAPDGLWYELTHRVIGFTLGLLTLSVAVVLWRREPRRWLRRLSYFAVLTVCLQALLGGLRVKLISDEALGDFAMSVFGTSNVYPIKIGIMLLHAFGAQFLFCLLVTIALALSSGWVQGHHPGEVSDKTRGTRKLLAWTLAVVFVQLLLGAYVRHSDGDGVLVHVLGAVVVVTMVFVAAHQTRRRHPSVWPIWHQLGLAKFLLFLQVFLGIVSWLFMRGGFEWAPPWDISMLVRTGHVANGAMILALLVAATCRGHKLLRTEEEDRRASRGDVSMPGVELDAASERGASA